jgi:sarcosine oxidase
LPRARARPSSPQAGIELPADLVHHARFTFPLRDPAAEPPCWLEQSGAWRPGFSSYGQPVGDGRWALGGHLSDDDVRWDLGLEEAVRRSREAVTEYVRAYLPGVVPAVVGVVTCDFTPGLGDGVHLLRSGDVHVVHGDNLFKMALAVAEALAREVTA